MIKLRDVVNSCRAEKKQCPVISCLLVKFEPCLNLTSNSTDEIVDIHLFTSRPEVHYVRNEVRRYTRTGSLEIRLQTFQTAGALALFSDFSAFNLGAACIGSSRILAHRARLSLSRIFRVEEKLSLHKECEKVSSRSFLRVSSLARWKVLAFRVRISLSRLSRGESLVSETRSPGCPRHSEVTSRKIEIFESYEIIFASVRKWNLHLF